MSDYELDCLEITDREDALGFLNSDDILLPDQLTLKKIRNRGSRWNFEDKSFNFRMERHPSPVMSWPGEQSPFRWHVQTCYQYDCETSEWSSTELSREFRIDPPSLIGHEFKQLENKRFWDERIDRVRGADDPQEQFEKEFEPVEEYYRELCVDVPDEKIKEILDVLRKEFRDRVEFE